MKKLLSILTITTLTASVPTPLLANAPLTRVKRDVGITEKDVNKNIPVLKTDGADIPTTEQIKTIVLQKNPIIKDITKINVTNITKNSARIFVVGYNGIITIHFKVDKALLLNEIIQNTNLGEFITSNLSKPTEQQIKDKLKDLNPQLDITKIKVENITLESARITSNDKDTYINTPINVSYFTSIISLIW